MKKVLISGHTGLGNFILKTPLILIIKKYYPECVIDIIAGNSYGSEFLLGESKLINNTYLLKQGESFFKKLKFFIKLRSEEYDFIFLPFDASSKMLFLGSFVANINKRVIHTLLRNKLKSIFYLLSPSTEVVAAIQGRHEIDLNLDLFEAIHGRPIHREYETFVAPKLVEGVQEKFSINSPYIVIQPGAANGANSAKKWSNNNFANLVKKINQNFPDLEIVAVGDKGDYENHIRPLEKEVSFINTAGKTSIAEVITIVSKSILVIANDSGVMHIANALNKNLIALYGPTDYTRTRPLGKKSHILYSKTDSFASMYNFRGDEVELAKKYPDSMDGITVDHVFRQVKKIIDEQY
jgi:heptosyltransferase-2